MIKPTVGRVVHYHGLGEDDMPGSDEARAAIVAHVHDDRCVNLTVFDVSGRLHSRTSVQLAQPEDPIPDTPHCCWIPFQVGQSQAVRDAQAEVRPTTEHRPVGS